MNELQDSVRIWCKPGIGQILSFPVMPLVKIFRENLSGYTLGCRTESVNIQLCVLRLALTEMLVSSNLYFRSSTQVSLLQ